MQGVAHGVGQPTLWADTYTGNLSKVLERGGGVSIPQIHQAPDAENLSQGESSGEGWNQSLEDRRAHISQRVPCYFAAKWVTLSLLCVRQALCH